MTRGTAAILLLAVLSAMSSRPAAAGTVTAAFENDRAAATDRHYTHGSYLSWTSATGAVPGVLARLGRAIPLLESGADRVGYVLGQTIFTPDEIEATELVRNDRPYAGWLHGGVRLVSEQPDGLQRLELDLGVVGPAAQADDVQSIVHELIRVQDPNGWDNQLDNEPGVLLIYERKWRRSAALPLGLDGVLIPHVSAALGNVFTLGAAGASVAVGDALAGFWGPARIYPGIRGSDAAPAGGGLRWSLFAGAELRLVGRNIFLDGNSFTDSHSVDKNPVVGDLQAGVQVSYGRLRAAFTYVLRSREFDRQDENDRFGAIMLSWRF